MEIAPPGARPVALRAAASAVIFEEGSGRLLLHRRSDNGLWGLPGGAVEIGESVAAAVVREVREETGLEVAVVRLIGIYSDPAFQVVRYPDGRVFHYVSAAFECRAVGGRLTLCDETLALDWFDPRHLPDDFVPLHRIRVADALARRPEAFIR